MELPYYVEYIQYGLTIVSILVLFLFAVESLTKEIQELATENFRKKISKLVKNRCSATIVGAIGTALMQSSTAMISIAIALVNTGVISFDNSLGVIFGSSIGTTITAQLTLIDGGILACLLLIIGYLLQYGGRNSKIIGKPLFFLGFILLSLNVLSSSIAPLKDNPDFVNMFSYLSNPFLAYMSAVLLTMLFHSSTITSSIVVILAKEGVIPLTVSVPMILGANLGTSITSLMTSKNLNLYAKRAGFANFLFKVIGTGVFMIFVDKFIIILQSLSGDLGAQTALGHLVFNVVNTIFFLIVMKPFEKLVVKMVPGDEEEVLFETKYIDSNDNTKNLKESIDDIKKELVYSMENTKKIFKLALSIYGNPSGSIIMEMKKLESLNDYLDDEITTSIVSLSKFKLSQKTAEETVILVKISNTIEQLGDLGMDLSTVFTKMHKADTSDSAHIEKLEYIFDMLMNLFTQIEKSVMSPKENELINIKKREEEIYAVIRKEFDVHVQKLQEDSKYDGSVFVDAVSIIELSVSKLRDIRKLLLKQVRELM